MKKRRYGFTLVELITVIAITGIILTFSTNWFLKNVLQANNFNNKQVDLQAGVSTSMELIKNVLKKTAQVTLVGKTVYDPQLSVEELNRKSLDKEYNYIGLKEETISYGTKNIKEYFLTNLVYNPKIDEMESIPMLAQAKDDMLHKSVVTYTMEFYKGDKNYKEKLNKKILNITLTGTIRQVDESGRYINPEENKSFELSEDIYLPNINQILISKYLKGNIEDVTAIAYNDSTIQAEIDDRVSEMTFVFAIDNSRSMDWPIDFFINYNEGEVDGNKKSITSSNPQRRKVAFNAINKFLEEIDNMGKDANVRIKIDAYIFTYAFSLLYNDFTTNPKYLYDIDTLSKMSETQTWDKRGKYLTKYGPYKLGWQQNGLNDAKSHLIDNCKLNNLGYDKRIGAGTNTGKAILQSLEILNQVKERNKKSKTFFILLTDGNPYAATYQNMYVKHNSGHNSQNLYPGYPSIPSFPGPIYGLFVNGFAKKFIYNKASFENMKEEQGDTLFLKYEVRNSAYIPTPNQYSFVRQYQKRAGDGHAWSPRFAMEFIKKVCESGAGNNRPDTFDKAFLIGFSKHFEEKSLIGYTGNSDNSISDQDYVWPMSYRHDDPEKFKNQVLQNQQLEFEDSTSSIRKYLAQEGTAYAKRNRIEMYDSDNVESLESAFSNIGKSIGDVMGAFDGPKELR